MGFLTPKFKQRVEVGRTDEFFFGTSSFGEILPEPHGVLRLSQGNIILSTGITQRTATTVETTGGKGGSVEQETTTDTLLYSVSGLIVKFAEKPSVALRRVWADKKLIYDITGSGLAQRATFTMRHLKGSEDQEPDPIYEDFAGTGLAPALRGSTCLVFEDFLLTDFGNRIPKFEAEFVFNETGLSATDLVEKTQSEVDQTFRDFDQYTQHGQSLIYVSHKDNDGYSVFSRDTLVKLREVTGLGNFELDGVGEKSGQRVYGSQTPANVFENRNSITGAVNFTKARSEDIGTIIELYNARDSSLMQAANNSSQRIQRYFTTFVDGNNISTSTSGAMDEITPTASEYGAFPCRATAEGAFGLLLTTSEMRPVFAGIGQYSDGTYLTEVATLTPADFGGTAFDTATRPRIVFDPVSLSLLIAFSMDGTNYIARWQTAAGPGHTTSGLVNQANPLLPFAQSSVLWVTPVNTFPINTQFSFSRSSVLGGRMVWNSNQKVVSINIATGEVDPVFDGTQDVLPDVPDYAYWDESRQAIFGNKSQRVVKYQIGTAADGNINVANLIEDLLVDAGLELWEEIDVSGVNTFVIKGHDSAGRKTSDILRGLEELFQFDTVESGGKIRAVPRGGNSVATIVEDDMVPTQENFREPYVSEKIQVLELPLTKNVIFTDPDFDYQKNEQSFSRSRSVVPIVESDGVEDIGNRAIVITAQTARRQAEVSLFVDWNEREKLKFRTDWRHLALDPTDVVTVTFNTGRSVRSRVENLDVGVDLSMDFLTSAEADSTQFSSTLLTDGGTAQGQIISFIGPSVFFLLDIPLLRDVDATDRSTSRSYFGLSTYDEATWPGGTLYRTLSEEVQREVGSKVTPLAWGVATNTLGDPPIDPFITDRTNTLDISVVVGADRFSSVSELDVRNEANYVVVIRSDGEVELLQFQTAAVIGDAAVRLSNLTRGRRGTEPYSTGHGAGETVVLLQATPLGSQTLDLASLDTAFTYTPVTSGQLFEQAIGEAKTLTGRDLFPHAPVNVTATDNSGDIDLAWVRRTRHGGELRDGVDTVPLNEDSESYEVDILDAAGGSVLRTLTSSSEAVTYASANVTSDLGGVPETLHLVIYQLSAQTGRGFPGTYSITVR